MARASFPVVLIALVAGLAACTPKEKAAPAGAATVEVSGALCRPTPVGRHSTGCYLTLKASADDRLVSLSTPLAGRAQVHESRMESNMMMMLELKDGLALPASQIVELKPGGNHIMLLGVEEPLKVGDTVPLTLTFATAEPVEVTAAVGQPAIADSGSASH
ncbi:copper(I)-binding protein [Brevundimonas alba]|uniref:Copper(I)-binding protein n=1 Tax=Brevundimonas alba TaxID=74314 RepID=A0A7X5YIW5_9CAUL|nr:copper chaperone PCu(A)C [Brevundimonas alba]NJC40006.1 copper(I)-binding protein [Brevundimonas alba]